MPNDTEYTISLKHWFEKGANDYVVCRKLPCGKWALFDNGDKQLGEPFAHWQRQTFTSGLFCVQPQENGLWGFVDNTGSLVIPPKFEYDKLFRLYHCDRMIYDGKVYDKHGESNIDLATKYAKWYGNYTDGFLLVATRHIPQGELNGDELAWGYLDINGNEVIPCAYHSANPFRCGRAVVEKMRWRKAKAYGGKLACTNFNGYGVIDENGKEIIPCKYKHIGFLYGLEDYYKGNTESPSDMLYKAVLSWRPRREVVIDGNGNVVPIERCKHSRIKK